MNYQLIYDALVSRAKGRSLTGYVERHHIVPKCIGGSDKSENIILLTAEEHYVAHQLLAKLHPLHRGLAWAALRLSRKSKNNKSYGWLKKRNAFLLSRHTGWKHSEETKKKMSVAATGRILDVETRSKLSAWHKNKKLSEAHRNKISVANSRPRGPMTEERKKNISKAKLAASLRRREERMYGDKHTTN